LVRAIQVISMTYTIIDVVNPVSGAMDPHRAAVFLSRACHNEIVCMHHFSACLTNSK
jgi:hypothetical protein